MGQTANFNVAGVTFKRRGQAYPGIHYIERYVGHSTKFIFEREPSNPHDQNAILIKLKFKKSGHKVVLGYVPAKLAREWAPLIDNYGYVPDAKFGMKFIHKKTGDCRGLQIRYETR